ncbi:MAG: flagellar hook-associated protein FlgK [Pseudohongiellaceae bacterium]|nr:flagellar hook-associated protein FlgK [Pseudohongiellaceae bacterium]
MSLINTAISGLKYSQAALSVAGQNIVNANTDGYSRQTISAATTTSVRTPAGYIGSGVTVTDIFRNTQQYLVDQVSGDISVLSEFDTYLSNISQTDNTLASSSSSLSTVMNSFFEALNESSNDPASLLGRQLLFTQTELLTQGFKTLENKLLSQNDGINRQFDTVSANMTTIAKEIAELNKTISDVIGSSEAKFPNDLLDRRDQLVRDLSQYVDVATVQKANRSIDVFIGEGQALVIAGNPREVVSVPGTLDPSRKDLAILGEGELRIVTEQLTGGEVGGLTRFRNEALEPALNALGRIAMAISDGINKQQNLGIDLEGNIGRSIFTELNDPAVMRNRVRADSRNTPPNDRELAVSIDDLSKLTTSSYDLNFPGPGKQYSLIRQSDGKLLAQGVIGERLPHEIKADGFTISISGGTFQAGDKFQIQPTKSGASDIRMQLTRPEAFAFASPIRTQSNVGNQGGAFILPGSVSDVTTPAFTTNPGQLSPPVIIRFTSPTTYDVLDYSDPANLVSLDPPLNNQRFAPGAVNTVFPDDPGGTTISTTGSGAGRINLGQGNNGYQQEVLSLARTNAESGFVTETRIQLDQNRSAAQIAQQLSNYDGVTATAFTQMQVSDFRSDGVGAPPTFWLNGVNITDPTIVQEGELFPEEIPDPLTPDFLRDRINNAPEFAAQGIYATSDGDTLSVYSTVGVDLNARMGGSGGDSMVVRDGNLRSVVGTKSMTTGVTIPPDTQFDVDLGFGAKTITLTSGSFSVEQIREVVQRDIDLVLGRGVVTASLNAAGKIELRSASGDRIVDVSNVTGTDPLGIAPITIRGPDTGATAAVFANGVDVRGGLNYTAQNGSFLLSIDSQYVDTISLTGNYPAGDGSALLTDVQNQIAASVGANGLAGRVSASLNADGQLEFTSLTTGVQSRISVTAGTGAQGIVRSGEALGLETSGTNARLVGAANIESGFDFDANGPHRFQLTVNGGDPVLVTITGSAVDERGVINLFDTQINAALTAAGQDNVRVGADSDGSLTIESDNYGPDSSLVLVNVVGGYGAVFASEDFGEASTSDFTIGGHVDVQLASGLSVTSDRTNGLFGTTPEAKSNYLGFQVSINSGQGEGGAPEAGDTFLVSYNKDGTADNRNGEAMLALNTKLTLSNNNLSLQGAYGQLVENTGILTSQARLSQEASETLLHQSMSALQSVSGVNVDEEAANLIKFEQHYNASARLISLAKELFDSLLGLSG